MVSRAVTAVPGIPRGRHERHVAAQRERRRLAASAARPLCATATREPPGIAATLAHDPAEALDAAVAAAAQSIPGASLHTATLDSAAISALWPAPKPAAFLTAARASRAIASAAVFSAAVAAASVAPGHDCILAADRRLRDE